MKMDIRELNRELLPVGELFVKVAYSSVNYKDALASVPNGKVVDSYPLVPGIDLAGTVLSSEDEGYGISFYPARRSTDRDRLRRCSHGNEATSVESHGHRLQTRFLGFDLYRDYIRTDSRSVADASRREVAGKNGR